MKKTYMNPSMNVLAVDEKDVIATSELNKTTGSGISGSYGDFVGGNNG